MKKDPSCYSKQPEQCSLRPDKKNFRNFEKNLICHKHCRQIDHSKLFFCEKSLSKKFDGKNGKKKCQNEKLKINIFLQKNFKNCHFEAKAYGDQKKF